jgi:hypothetical protein
LRALPASAAAGASAASRASTARGCGSRSGRSACAQPRTGLYNDCDVNQLAEAVGQLVDAGWPLRQLTDHGTHLAVYLSDPDGNDLELAWDRPFEQWPRFGAEDAPAFDTPFELDELLAAR